MQMLKMPQPLAVEAVEGPDGWEPRWVVWRGKRRRVATIEEVWQIEDEWFSVSPSRIVGVPERQDRPETLPKRPPAEQERMPGRVCVASADLPRQGEISRRYFTVTFADGCRVTLFHDLIEGTWWAQRY